MSKPRTPSQRKAYRNHAQRLRKYVAQVQSVYDALCQRAASIVEASGYDGEGEFSFGDYADIERDVKDMMAQFVREMQLVVHSGTSEEWRQSNIIQDLLAKKVLKSYRAQVDGEKTKAYFQSNSDALKAFQERVDHGLNLSDRIWNSVPSVRRELECTISTAVEKGFSAVTLSKRLSQYLNDFPSMQRDYTEKYGHAADCRDCEFNSIRLARTEINMAYRTAEQKRWQQFDFVTGYEIKLSGSHPRADICDDLQGKYPKDFVWTGWHPQCLCMALPIIMSEDDYWRMREGEVVKEQQITEVPDKVNEWVSDNADRIERAAERDTLPYWLRDNQSLLDGVAAKNVEPALREIIVEEKDIHDMFDTSSPEYTARIKARRKYNSYSEDWERAYFNEKSGGFNVYHRSHQFSDTRAERLFVLDEKPVKAKMTGGEAEKHVGRILADFSAKQVEFLPENGKGTGKPDLAFDSHTWDVKYISMANENTIRKYIEDARKADCVIFYWDEDSKLVELKNAIDRTIGKFRKKGKLATIPSVYYISDRNELLCIFDNTVAKVSGIPKK